MPCPHQYLGLNIDEMLFPNWDIEHLFVGTFNPLWDRPDAVNAAYFYGRSAYFWDAVSIFFEDRTYGANHDDQQAMIGFCKKHKIGFTDLIRSVEDADWNNQDHRRKIYSVKDDDLEGFDTIDWNTAAIEDFLERKRPKNIFFTLLSTNIKSIFSREMRKIEMKAASLKINNRRLHSPTGARLGNGVPRLHQLLERWNRGLGLPGIDLARYPYVVNERVQKNNRVRKKKPTGAFSDPGDRELLVMGRYGLSLKLNGKVVLFDPETGIHLKAKTVIRDIIIPHIKLTYGIDIDLNYSSKN